VRRTGCRHLLFATRDCVHMSHIFRAMYPELAAEAHYFHCSRNLFRRARAGHNRHYDRYVSACTGGGDIARTVYIDVHATGARMTAYFARRWGAVPHCFLVSGANSTAAHLPKRAASLWRQGRMRVLMWGVAGAAIEMLNYDVIGTANDFTRAGPVRAPPEYDVRLLQPYHRCVAHFVGLLHRARPQQPGQDHAGDASEHRRRAARRPSPPCYGPDVARLLKMLAGVIGKHQSQPAISRWIVHERVHPADTDATNAHPPPS